MDSAIISAFSSSLIARSSAFSFAEAVKSSYNISYRASHPTSSTALFGTTLGALEPTVTFSFLSANTNSSGLHSFGRFDNCYEESVAKFEKAFKKCFARKDNKAAQIIARKSSETEQENITSRGRNGFTQTKTTHYVTLGISHDASQKEIALAYRKLARQCHPDLVPLDQLVRATKLFCEINEAYEILSDPEKRIRYDMKLALQKKAASVPAGYGRSRTYTDMSTGRIYPSISSFYREWKDKNKEEAR